MVNKKNKPMKKKVPGDKNFITAGKGDTKRPVEKGKFDKNFNKIDWSKGRKKDKDKKYKVTDSRESDRAFNRRLATP